MEVKETRIKKHETIVDIICDSCLKSCKVNEGVIDNPSRIDNGEIHCTFEFMELKADWGYWSGKDNERMVAQICEKCVDEKLSFINFRKSTISYIPTLTD